MYLGQRSRFLWKNDIKVSCRETTNRRKKIFLVFELPPAVDVSIRGVSVAPYNGLAGLPFMLNTDKELDMETLDWSCRMQEISVNLSYIQRICYGSSVSSVINESNFLKILIQNPNVSLY